MKTLKKISFKELGQRQIMNTTEMKNILGGGATGTLSPGGGAIFTCQCDSRGANVPYLAQWTAYYHDDSIVKDLHTHCVGTGTCTKTDPYSL